MELENKKKYDYYLYLLDCSFDLELLIAKHKKSRIYRIKWIYGKIQELNHEEDIRKLRKYINSIDIFNSSVQDLDYFRIFIENLKNKYNVGN